jgi:hypothetical protein
MGGIWERRQNIIGATEYTSERQMMKEYPTLSPSNTDTSPTPLSPKQTSLNSDTLMVVMNWF